MALLLLTFASKHGARSCPSTQKPRTFLRWQATNPASPLQVLHPSVTQTTALRVRAVVHHPHAVPATLAAPGETQPMHSSAVAVLPQAAGASSVAAHAATARMAAHGATAPTVAAAAVCEAAQSATSGMVRGVLAPAYRPFTRCCTKRRGPTASCYQSLKLCHRAPCPREAATRQRRHPPMSTLAPPQHQATPRRRRSRSSPLPLHPHPPLPPLPRQLRYPRASVAPW